MMILGFVHAILELKQPEYFFYSFALHMLTMIRLFYFLRFCSHADRKDRMLLISDFGLSRETDTGATSVASGATTNAADNSYGTIAWSAPEFFLSRKADPYKADLYALGVVMWEVVTREFPFKVTNLSAGIMRSKVPCLLIGGALMRARAYILPRETRGNMSSAL